MAQGAPWLYAGFERPVAAHYTAARLWRSDAFGHSPLAIQQRTIANGRFAAVFLHDPTVQPADLTVALMEEYRMTRAEAMLTSALASGLSLSQYAERAKVSLNTVRTQLSNAAAKTGAKRQADLVRIVLTGPAVMRYQAPAPPWGGRREG